MATDWLALGATALGGLLGSKAGGNQTQTESQTRDPWAPAQNYMLQNLKNEEALQTALQKNPFNPQQIQGYSNLFGDIGNYRDNVMPGLMDFANKGMTSSYQRQTGGAPGSGGGYGGAVRPGGLMQSGQGAFSVNRGAGSQNGLLDLNGAQNPYANGSVKPPTASLATPLGIGGLLFGSGGGNGNGNGTGGSASSGSLSVQDAALKALALGDMKALRMLSPSMAALFGLGGGAVLDGQIDGIGRDMGALNDQAAYGGMAATGIGTRSDVNSNVSTYSNDASIAAQDAANFGDYGGGLSANGGPGADSGSQDADGNDGWNAKGGYIEGPGTGTSDSIPSRLSNGEYVIKASSVKKYGKGLLADINAGRYKG